MIETACFFLYMFSATVYILIRQLQSAWCDSLQVSDRKKALMDFLSYSHYNLIWFSINFVLCTMPLVALFISNENLYLKGKDQSLVPITLTLWGMHTIVFLCQVFIYQKVEHKDEPKAKPEALKTSFDKDDGFKL